MNKINVGMRVSTRRDGVGTVIRSNGGIGWVICFDDSSFEAIVQDRNIWTEDGETALG